MNKESIQISLGLDSSKLTRGLDESKKKVSKFSKSLEKEIAQGDIPDSWKKYKETISKLSAESQKMLKSGPGKTGMFASLKDSILGAIPGAEKLIGVLGRLSVIGAVIGTVVYGLKTVKDEMDRIYSLASIARSKGVSGSFMSQSVFSGRAGGLTDSESIQTVDSVLSTIGRASGGDQAAMDIFRRMGVSVKGRKVQDIFSDVKSKISSIGDVDVRSQLLKELGDESGNLAMFSDKKSKFSEDQSKVLLGAKNIWNKIQPNLIDAITAIAIPVLVRGALMKYGGKANDADHVAGSGYNERINQIRADNEKEMAIFNSESQKKLRSQLASNPIVAEYNQSVVNVATKANEILLLQREIAATSKETIEYTKKQNDLEGKKTELLQAQYQQRNAAIALQQKRLSIERAGIDIDTMQRQRYEAYMPSTDELAHSPVFGGQVMQMKMLERFAKRAFMLGDTKSATEMIDSRNNIQRNLSNLGVSPVDMYYQGMSRAKQDYDLSKQLVSALTDPNTVLTVKLDVK